MSSVDFDLLMISFSRTDFGQLVKVVFTANCLLKVSDCRLTIFEYILRFTLMLEEFE